MAPLAASADLPSPVPVIQIPPTSDIRMLRNRQINLLPVKRFILNRTAVERQHNQCKIHFPVHQQFLRVIGKRIYHLHHDSRIFFSEFRQKRKQKILLVKWRNGN